MTIPEIDQARYAGDLLTHIADLQGRVDEILDPLVARILTEGLPEEVAETLAVLPQGKHRKRLERTAEQIKAGLIPQGRRPTITLAQIRTRPDVVYSDAHLDHNKMWLTTHTLSRRGRVIDHVIYDDRNEPVAEPGPLTWTAVVLRWEDGNGGFVDYEDELPAYALSAIPAGF